MKTAMLGLICVCGLHAQVYTISTFAGLGVPVSLAGNSVSVGVAGGLALDASGNVYFSSGQTVLRIDAATKTLSLVAGSGTQTGDGGPATAAQLNQPNGLAMDAAGNLYIAEQSRIRKVSGGIITTVAQVPAVALAVDSGGAIYFAENVSSQLIPIFPGGVLINSGVVRMISNGVTTTLAGSGVCCGPTADNVPATSTPLYEPSGIAVDPAGNVYVSSGYDPENPGAIRKISGGVITTMAGPGLKLFALGGLAFDAAGDLFFADQGNNQVREISGGAVNTVAGYGPSGYGGDGGPATGARLYAPQGIALDSAGNLYIADAANYAIREVSNGIISTAAGNGYQNFSGDNGPATAAQFYFPFGVAADSFGNLYIADRDNSRVRKVSNGIVTTVTGNGGTGYSGDNGPAAAAEVFDPQDLAVDRAGNLFISDINRIREISNGVITTVAGGGSGATGFGDGGPATSAYLEPRQAVAVDSAGNLYLLDPAQNRVREVSNGIIHIVAGNGTAGYSGDGGLAVNAELNGPSALAVDSAGNLYIADTRNGRIREVSGGIITTVAGGGTVAPSPDGAPATDAQLNSPVGVAVDSAGNLYISDTGLIRRVSGGVIASIAGNGTPGYLGDHELALDALITPVDLTVDPAGNVYFSEPGANRVRMLRPQATPSISAVLSAASFQPGIEAGSWAMIQGSNLADSQRTWRNSDFVGDNLPTSLDGVSVTIDGKPAFVEYISSSQINLQVPSDSATGAVNVVVDNNGVASNPIQVTLQSAAPAFFLSGANTVSASLLPNYTPVSGTSPAHPGDLVVLWGTGFGPTTPAVAAGTVVTGAPSVSPIPLVTVGGMQVAVISTTLVAGAVGLYQVTIQLPADDPTGTPAVQAMVGSMQSAAGVTLFVSRQ